MSAVQRPAAYHQIINGNKYKREILYLAERAAATGNVISKSEADEILKCAYSGKPGDTVTQIELDSLDLVRAKYTWTEPAKLAFDDFMATHRANVRRKSSSTSGLKSPTASEHSGPAVAKEGSSMFLPLLVVGAIIAALVYRCLA
ncbi:hypothetical protein T492DRAFT_994121 [Pavlovales sp. CCMP2436]|nr:hypothetical protein T492DRAFT_994121 [Pavlovales sp. CCMP2436]